MIANCDETHDDLVEIASRIRKDIVGCIHNAGCGHPGGSLSAVEILTALYFHTLHIDPEHPSLPTRDRFILSKGHASAALYAVLANRGYFPKHELDTFDCLGSIMQAHPDMHLTPGVDMSAGSLGQGLSVGVGMALGARLLNQSFKVYVLLGDGELQEGQVWEAAFAASRYSLENLVAIVDNNEVQLYGWQHPKPLPPMTNLKEKFQAFGWRTLRVNGHDMGQIVDALNEAIRSDGRPSVIVADTVKGKGVSYMEGRWEWHAKAPNDDECRLAMDELEGCR